MRTILALAAGAAALVAIAPASGQERRNIFADPQNLQVLPADISPAELGRTMRGFALGLGLRCQHCHVGAEDQPLSSFDFAADAKPRKQVAREMLRMVADINARTAAVAALFERPATEVRCVTCHRGRVRPQLISEVLDEALADGGAEALIERYKALREEYYGTGSFDFSELTLTLYAIDVFRRGEKDASIALQELNRDLNPESANAHFSLGRGYEVTGRFEEAAESYRRALALEPEFSRAKAQLEAVEEKLAAQPEE